ncbi:hypothetical protein BOO86_15425 [Mycobacterium sp. CBMA 234]|uniref:spirocyclase AveC family protein n=1 Tax=Mycolicibacterium sp. CBMA 234 TaxID=1918495 RepID=UPI0012DF5C26|nr:spirocyclase AveC family protein [Mycolicibacterium sp. CBMA 234]MUL65865.1 hypothetical protein [Mycolicibacterium sp. CBMA 234]
MTAGTRVQSTRPAAKLTFARVLAVFGVALVAYEAVTWARWLAGGPHQITAYRDTAAASWTAARGYEVLIAGVSVWLLVRVIRECRRQRRLTVDAQLLIAGVTALFWDPFGNFFQPAFFYSSNWLNLNTWTGYAPLVVNPDASLMPQPVFIMLVYPFGLLAFAMMSNAVMRAVQRRFPDWSNGRVLAAGALAAFVGGVALEAPMFLLHLWSLPGAPRGLSLFDNAHRYAAVEYLTTGMVFAGWAAVRYFRDDRGRAFTERGVGQAGSVFAMIAWCCSLLLVLQVVVSLFAFKAAAYPDEFPRHLVNGLCDVGATTGTHYGPCPGSPGFRMPIAMALQLR